MKGEPRFRGTIEEITSSAGSYRQFGDDYKISINGNGKVEEFRTNLGLCFSDINDENFQVGDEVMIWGSTIGKSFYRIEHTISSREFLLEKKQ